MKAKETRQSVSQRTLDIYRIILVNAKFSYEKQMFSLGITFTNKIQHEQYLGKIRDKTENLGILSYISGTIGSGWTSDVPQCV
jgi:hypothetical protein